VIEVENCSGIVAAEEKETEVLEAGFQGPPGRDGSPGSGFQYVAYSASTLWTINHNLGIRPGVTIVDTGGNELDAQVIHVNANQLQIHFNEPVAGFARLV
jgi:hypothetical protein